MPSRIFSSGWGNAFSQRCSNHGVLLPFGRSGNNSRNWRFARHEWTRRGAITQPTRLLNWEVHFYGTLSKPRQPSNVDGDANQERLNRVGSPGVVDPHRSKSSKSQKELKSMPLIRRWKISSSTSPSIEIDKPLRTRKNRAPTPPQLLASWLDPIRPSFSLSIYREDGKVGSRYSKALPTILVEYMYRQKYQSPDSWKSLQSNFMDRATESLHKRGYSYADVASWAKILSGSSVEEIVELLYSTESKKPTFLLLEILRRDISSARTLKSLLIYTWNHIMGRPISDPTLLSHEEAVAEVPWLNFSLLDIGHVYRPPRLDPTTHSLLLNRLLNHLLRLYPQALVSLAQMAATIMITSYHARFFISIRPRDLYRDQASEMLNRMILLLSRPCSINPVSSMIYNWQAQKIMLEVAEQFDPPLLLDGTSHRAISAVLVALKKSEDEIKASKSRARSWPPWHIDQDGMDAKRPLDDDFSRAVRSVNLARESGYTADGLDHAFKILGGQEPDGTPSIQTRFKATATRGLLTKDPLRFQKNGRSRQWTARIGATRDIQEAWAAFSQYEEDGHSPTMSMYSIMFEKLIQNKFRHIRKTKYNALPGDGKEVFPPSDDTYSELHKLSLRPPTINELFDRMISRSGHRPSGELLNLLLANARTPSEGVRYLFYSKLSPRAKNFLGKLQSTHPIPLQKCLHGSTIKAFISLLCRFTPREVVAVPNEPDSHAPNKESRPTMNQITTLEIDWQIDWTMGQFPRLSDPLLHSVNLLKRSRTDHRPAWYALFRCLGYRDVIVDRNLVGNPKNQLLKWQVLVASLQDFHQRGLELDPTGFLPFCNALENALLASSHIPSEEQVGLFTIGSSQIQIIKDEFMKLTEVVNSPKAFGVPKFLHEVGGTHIHAYIRVLGLAKDYEGIIHVLKWMRQYPETWEVPISTRKLSNDHGKTFIATRFFLIDTIHESEAKEIINSVEEWNGWPGEDDIQKYSRYHQEDDLGEALGDDAGYRVSEIRTE